MSKGRQFEILNVANIVLNSVQNDKVKNFYLSSTDETCGDFGSIVVNVETEKGTEVYALQVKHKKSGAFNYKDLLRKKGDFGIQTFFTSFNSIENKAQKFIFYTNAKCKAEIDKPFRLKGEDFSVKLIKVNLEDTFKISGRTNSCYKFEVVEDSPTEKSLAYRKFFESFWLYTSQENVYCLPKKVNDKFKSVFVANETESDVYLKFITKWCNEDSLKEKLNKEWMQHVIAVIILSSRVKPLFFQPVNDKVKIFQKAINEFHITVFENNYCEQVVKLWGNANTKPYDIKELNYLRTKFQLFDTYISDIDTVDINIASKLLWLMGTCPLIVTGDKTVYKAIELCPNKKFILLEKNSFVYPRNFSSVFTSLCDLDERSNIFLELIKICTCSLQGKNKFNLESLIKEFWELLEGITTDDLLEMILGVCNADGEKEKLPDPYIERCLVRNIIDLSYLESFKHDTIVIVDCVENVEVLKNAKNKLIYIDDLLDTTEENKSLKIQQEESNDFNSAIYYSKAMCSFSTFKSISEKHEDIKIHHFRLTQDGKLELIRNKGDVKDFQKYQTDLFIDETKLFASRPKENINLIVSDPGMGKSVLMQSLKNKSLFDWWTVIISPKDVFIFCKSITTQENLVESLDKFLINRLNGRDKLFFENCVERNNVAYVWDGVDEIADDQLKIVVKIIVEFSLMERVQWVTSRCRLKHFLESELSTVAFSLTEIDSKTQISYIQTRLEIDSFDVLAPILNRIQLTFVIAKQKNILGIPLELFMLTNCFLHDRRKYMAILTHKCAFSDLYYHFIEEQIRIYIIRRKDIPYQPVLVYGLRDIAQNSLRHVALTVLFPPEILKSLNVIAEINEQERKECKAIGLVINFTNDIPCFIHHSFVEFLVAAFFAENYDKFKNVIKDVLFEPRFLDVRYFFDMIMTQEKNCRTHVALMYKNFDLLKSYESEIKTSKDEGGRNVLHLACSWGQRHPTLKVVMVDSSYVIDDDYTSNITPETEIDKLLVNYLLNSCDISEADILFDMTPLSYAQKSGNLWTEIKIMTKQGINIFELDNEHAANILYYSTLLGYDEVIDVFKTNNEENETCKLSYVNMKNNKNMTLLFIACDKGYEKIVEFLVANGSQVNLANQNGVTPLYVASQNGHQEIVEILVANGSQVNLANKEGFTPLHAASLNGYERIVEFLVSSGCQVNLADKHGFTPLDVASLNGHQGVVKLLVAATSK